MQPTTETAPSYDGRTLWFHWLTVLLVLGQWLGAHTIDWFPKGWPRTDVRSLHITLGTLLAILIVLRLGWRWSGGRKLPAADTGVLRIVATTVHGTLYVLVIATVALGLLNAWLGGANLFSLFSLPKPGFDTKALQDQVGNLHPLAANAILLVAALHACAALWHQYGRRDGVLGRMIPALRPRAPLGSRDRQTPAR
jgi:cytochrome b561